MILHVRDRVLKMERLQEPSIAVAPGLGGWLLPPLLLQELRVRPPQLRCLGIQQPRVDIPLKGGQNRNVAEVSRPRVADLDAVALLVAARGRNDRRGWGG